jgi:hypothetical protein
LFNLYCPVGNSSTLENLVLHWFCRPHFLVPGLCRNLNPSQLGTGGIEEGQRVPESLNSERQCAVVRYRVLKDGRRAALECRNAVGCSDSIVTIRNIVQDRLLVAGAIQNQIELLELVGDGEKTAQSRTLRQDVRYQKAGAEPPGGDLRFEFLA